MGLYPTADEPLRKCFICKVRRFWLILTPPDGGLRVNTWTAEWALLLVLLHLGTTHSWLWRKIPFSVPLELQTDLGCRPHLQGHCGLNWKCRRPFYLSHQQPSLVCCIIVYIIEPSAVYSLKTQQTLFWNSCFCSVWFCSPCLEPSCPYWRVLLGRLVWIWPKLQVE